MTQEKELPILHGEKLFIPFVGAIIERKILGKQQVLVQIREKPSDTAYSGCIEIPGGKMQAHEDIYESIKREVKEECGLDITFVHGEDKRIDYPNKGDTSTLIEPFCITQMKEGSLIGVIFLCRAIGEPLQQTAESKDAKWIDVSALRQIVMKTPDQIYTAFLAPLKKYLGC